MPLRYNAHELAILARKASSCFDKEGPLLMKDKQEGLFRKGETYMQRLFRLRGNLLFYFKTKDPNSEVLGVYVLERCMVQLDPEDETDRFGFVIMFENEDRPLKLSAASESERAGWIEMLHIASYECMKMQMQSLREQLRTRTGHDPLEEQNESPTESRFSVAMNTGEPLFELALACEKLPRDPSGKVPDTFVAVHYSTPQKQHWFPLGHTEVVEKSSSPSYLTSVGIYPQQQLIATDLGKANGGGTKVKLMVYDVKERMTSTMTQIGSTVFSLDDLMNASDDFLHLSLCESVNSTSAGFITVTVLRNASEKETKAIKKLDVIEQFYDNMQVKAYHFPSNFGRDLRVHEYLAESKLCFQLPVQLLTLWVEEEKNQIEQLQDLGELTPALEVTRKELLDFHMSTISTYMQNIRYLSTYQGAPFKPSTKKGHKEVEFAPTNLHLQRMWVQNVDRNTNSFYDITTVGAFTAYVLKYKHGGLRRLQSQLQEVTGQITGAENQINVATVMNQLEGTLAKVDQLSEEMCRAALTGDADELTTMLKKLETDMKSLIEHCSNPLVEEGVLEHSEMRTDSTTTSPHLSPPEGSWKWSGTDFVKSPTEEPWELTRLNTEAALVCVISMVEELVKDETSALQWLEKLSPLMIRLKSCVQVMCQRAKSGLMFLSVKVCPGHVPLLHTIKYRHDIIFSQALTAVVSAVETMLHCNFGNELYMKQLLEIGILLDFEGLLSCYTAEMGMIEDMCVAVAALKSVSFRLIQTLDGEHPKPVVESNNMILTVHYPDMSRSGYVVTLALPEAMFDRLPAELRLGHFIKLIPVFYNIGINEQATLAEKIGDLTVQEEVNFENYKCMFDYYTAFVEFTDKENAEMPGDLEQLMRILQVEAMKKKPKNVDLLHTAASVTRFMRGLRFTSCKSAKDRTAMSVTLEMTQILLNEHGLNDSHYVHALDCIRSQGVRLENTKKNTGTRKYAFNSLQLLSVPRLYRPPSGTYGNIQT